MIAVQGEQAGNRQQRHLHDTPAAGPCCCWMAMISARLVVPIHVGRAENHQDEGNS